MTHRLMAVTCGALAAAFVSCAGAVAPQRTFVSSGGNDTNPCSLTSPCRSFTAAVAAVGTKGEVIILDSAAYGTVTITKSVSLIAPSGIYAGVTVSIGDGITVNAPGEIVVLRGLSINGQGGDNGINLLQAARLRIENCVISNMGVDGIMHSAVGAELIVLDTIVRDNGASGIGGDANASVVLDHVRSEHNGTNGFYMASLGGYASATITDSVFAFNGSNGIWIAATGSGVTQGQVERSVVSENFTGIKITATAFSADKVGITRNVIHNNTYGVAAFGPGFALATVFENAIGSNVYGISTDGAGTNVEVSANSLTTYAVFDFVQSNSSYFASYGNNVGRFTSTGAITLVTGH